MKSPLKYTLMAFAVALVTAFAAGDLAAQQPIPADPPEPPERDELVTFTEAYIDINEVRAEFTPRIAATEDPEEATALQQEANNAMISALEDHEMEPERYTEITAVLNQDEELRAEFEEIYEEIVDDGV